MPTIPNFPQDLTDQHHYWHDPTAHPEFAGPGRVHLAGTRGGGVEFLRFHRDFMAQVLSWYNATDFDEVPFNDPIQKADLVSPWTAVPGELKDAALGWTKGWREDEDRLRTGDPEFPSADELGDFIEQGIHNNFLHGAAGANFEEPIVRSLHSPQSTLFYKIHGLVDYWWSQWQRRLNTSQLDPRTPHDDPFEVNGSFLHDHVPDGVRRLDPRVLHSLSERLSRIEREIFPMRAKFMRPSSRKRITPEAATPRSRSASR